MKYALRPVPTRLRPAPGRECAGTGTNSDDFRSDDFRSRCLWAGSARDGYSLFGGSASDSSRDYFARAHDRHSHRAADPELVGHSAEHCAGDAAAGQPNAGQSNKRRG